MTVFVNELKVEFVHSAGNDLSPVNAAKISMGKSTDVMDEKAEKLMNYLAKHKHMTPFEHQFASFIIHCPLYVRSQIHRHRTFSYNEMSRRYTSDDISFYLPKVFHYQGVKDKQKAGEPHNSEFNKKLQAAIRAQCEESESNYNVLLEHDVAREEARMILPQNLMTKFWMSGNLRNWSHFLELRLDPHAQLETQIIAKQVSKKLFEIFPKSTTALMLHSDLGNENAEKVNALLSGDKLEEL